MERFLSERDIIFDFIYSTAKDHFSTSYQVDFWLYDSRFKEINGYFLPEEWDK